MSTGWWFGTFGLHLDYFSIQLGISSSQLTKSIMFQRCRSTTNHLGYGYGRIGGIIRKWYDLPGSKGKIVRPISAGHEDYPLVICYIAIENGPVEIVNFPNKNGDFPSFYVNVYQRAILQLGIAYDTVDTVRWVHPAVPSCHTQIGVPPNHLKLFWLVVWNIVLFFHILRISSSQLTNSYFSEGRSTTNQLHWFMFPYFPFLSTSIHPKSTKF